jgi:hypothetical protein
MKTPNFVAVRFAVAVVAVAVLTLAMAVMPALAQNATPPTARQVGNPGPIRASFGSSTQNAGAPTV